MYYKTYKTRYSHFKGENSIIESSSSPIILIQFKLRHYKPHQYVDFDKSSLDIGFGIEVDLDWDKLGQVVGTYLGAYKLVVQDSGREDSLYEVPSILGSALA